jgi:hypothetical protein
MSSIQRWNPTLFDTAMMEPLDEGEYVTYADHVEALRQAEQRGREEGVEYAHKFHVCESYEQGQRDALAASEEAMQAMFRAGAKDALAGAVFEMNPVSEDFPDLLDRDAVLDEIKGDSDE